MTTAAPPPTPPGRRLPIPALLTFGAVFLSILCVGSLVAPSILGFAERIYLELLDDSNQRQARAMIQFLDRRLASGLSRDQVAAEFQSAIAGTETDRGYVCLIEQGEVRYVSHPNQEQLGMRVKPEALFDPGIATTAQTPWDAYLRDGATAAGHLSYGPGMTQEMVYFTQVPGTSWTLSTHENLARVEDELSALRRNLLRGSMLIGLLLAIPASAAARIVSRRNERQIELRGELERRLLEEEDRRKSAELEEARQLQLSLLPRQLPELPGVELAARMETATEVGGDYYDFLVENDDELLLAIGDATGHGLQAGMMATAVKSLFALCARQRDLVSALESMAEGLRRMRLGRRNMAFALARLSDRRLELVGAGMPPALVYRASDDRLERISLDGLPLGSPLPFPYQRQQVDLTAGDLVLLSSDGLPEAGGADPLGYEGCERAFLAAARRDSQPAAVIATILDSLRGEPSPASREALPEALEDDVTLLVLRAR
ncbi:MAG: SpoIIE family protein phosphatase [Acidobacteriota bacterium]